MPPRRGRAGRQRPGVVGCGGADLPGALLAGGGRLQARERCPCSLFSPPPRLWGHHPPVAPRAGPMERLWRPPRPLRGGQLPQRPAGGGTDRRRRYGRNGRGHTGSGRRGGAGTEPWGAGRGEWHCGGDFEGGACKVRPPAAGPPITLAATVVADHAAGVAASGGDAAPHMAGAAKEDATATAQCGA